MTEFNNKKLVGLIREFGWQEGAMEDFYFHPQDRKKLKPILTKRACAQLADARNFKPVAPHVQEVAGRVAVSGYWSNKDESQMVWTTGEANPGGKSVEGSHPVAMAEKRWKARGIIALECGEGSGIYAEDEFTDEYKQEARRSPAPKSDAPADTKEPQKAEPPSDKTAQALEWINGALAAITESTGIPRAEIARPLYLHSTPVSTAKGYAVPTDKYPNAVDLISLCHESPEWALNAYKQLAEVRDALKNGQDVQLDRPNEGKTDLVPGIKLSPRGGGGSLGPTAAEDEGGQ